MQGGKNETGQERRSQKLKPPTEIALQGSTEKEFLEERSESCGEAKTGEAHPKVALIDPPHHRMDFGSGRRPIRGFLDSPEPPSEVGRRERKHQSEDDPDRGDREHAEVTDASRPDLAPETASPMKTDRDPKFAPRDPAPSGPE